MPPMSIQTALSVGDPVKNLAMSELNELVALMPMTMRTIPPVEQDQRNDSIHNELSRNGLPLVFTKTPLWFQSGVFTLACVRK